MLCRYAHLSLSKRRTPDQVQSLRAKLVALVIRIVQLLRTSFPAQLDMLTTYHRGRSYLGEGAGPFTAITMGENYFNTLHVDPSDAPLSFITWWLLGCGSITGGGFRLANVYLQFTPLHGTLICLNTRVLYHGTLKCSATGSLRRIGSAIWHREDVIAAEHINAKYGAGTWYGWCTAKKDKVNATMAELFDVRACMGIIGTNVWGWRPFAHA